MNLSFILLMSWYKIFYWITVAERIQTAIQTFAVVCTILLILCSIIWVVARFSYVENMNGGYNASDNVNRAKSYMKFSKHGVRASFPFFLLLWTLYIAIPSKSDAILIVAGGAVGNFVTNDSASRQIPSEITNLLKDKIKAWRIEALSTDEVTDSLKSKTKEELIDIIKTDHQK